MATPCPDTPGEGRNNLGRQINICVEGNVAVGKTTFLNYFSKEPYLEIVEEPVNRWKDIHGFNVYNLQTQDPKKWCTTMQSYALLTMMQVHVQPQVKPIRLMERSIHSGRYCFTEALHKGGLMEDLNYYVLDEWFGWLTATQNIRVDRIVYLRADPEIVRERLQHRQRQEDKDFTIEYLRTIHDLHDDWLIHKKFPSSVPVDVIDANGDPESIHRQYESKIKSFLSK